MRAHPRSRGENSAPGCGCRHRRGSSPLTRGKLRTTPTMIANAGLIPAHAGKTIDARPRGPLMRAHPRSRGENWAASSWRGRAVGSSPLTRGKLRPGCDGAHDWGLIPAHAGKTVSFDFLPFSTRAHPRSRGENAQRGNGCEPHRGSSPLTRGKPSPRRRPVSPTGLIPAHAGKTGRSHPTRA